MRFVDREQAHVTFGYEAAKGSEADALRRDEEKVEGTRSCRLGDGPTVAGLLRRAQEGGPQPRLLRTTDLVFHEGNERRDHQREAARCERGNLIADALTSPGRQDAQGISARENRAHELLLSRTESGIAEVFLKQRDGVGGHPPRSRTARAYGMGERDCWCDYPPMAAMRCRACPA